MEHIKMIKCLYGRKPLKTTTTYFAMIASVGVTWLATTPMNPANAAKFSPPSIKEVVQAHPEHIRVLYKVAKCLAKSNNRKVLAKAIKDSNTNKVRNVQKKCISGADLRVLQSAPNTTHMSADTRNKVLGSNRNIITNLYQSISVGLGPSAALVAGIALDGGLTWNLDGSGPIRSYNSTATGIGAQINIGADPIVIGLYPSKVSPGISRSSLITASVEAGPSVSVGQYISTTNKLDGLMFALGTGVGFNLATKYNVKTNVHYLPCNDVTVRAHNRTGSDIKIIDVDFHHYSQKKWHSKVTWNKKVKKDNTYVKTFKKLKDVGHDKMQIRVQYKLRTGKLILNRYTNVVRDWSKSQICHDGKTIDVYLKNTK